MENEEYKETIIDDGPAFDLLKQTADEIIAELKKQSEAE
jgi:hypothetical protein